MKLKQKKKNQYNAFDATQHIWQRKPKNVEQRKVEIDRSFDDFMMMTKFLYVVADFTWFYKTLTKTIIENHLLLQSMN